MSDDDARPVSKVARRTLIAGAAVAVPATAVLNAGSAWAKPVVASLTGVSAFSASQPTPTVSLGFTHLQANPLETWAPNDERIFNGLSGSTEPQLDASQLAVAVGSIQLSISVPKSAMVADASKVVIGGGSRATWTCTGAQVSGDNVVYTFSWSGGPILSTGSARAARLEFTLPGSGSLLPKLDLPRSISATAAAAGVGSAATQATINTW